MGWFGVEGFSLPSVTKTRLVAGSTLAEAQMPPPTWPSGTVVEPRDGMRAADVDLHQLALHERDIAEAGDAEVDEALVESGLDQL